MLYQLKHKPVLLPTGTVALAEYVADNWQLVRLDLRENDLRTGGLMALSYAMKVNKALLRLDLDKDVKREQVCDFFFFKKQKLVLSFQIEILFCLPFQS